MRRFPVATSQMPKSQMPNATAREPANSQQPIRSKMPHQKPSYRNRYLTFDLRYLECLRNAARFRCGPCRRRAFAIWAFSVDFACPIASAIFVRGSDGGFQRKFDQIVFARVSPFSPSWVSTNGAWLTRNCVPATGPCARKNQPIYFSWAQSNIQCDDLQDRVLSGQWTKVYGYTWWTVGPKYFLKRTLVVYLRRTAWRQYDRRTDHTSPNMFASILDRISCKLQLVRKLRTPSLNRHANIDNQKEQVMAGYPCLCLCSYCCFPLVHQFAFDDR